MPRSKCPDCRAEFETPEFDGLVSCPACGLMIEVEPESYSLTQHHAVPLLIAGVAALSIGIGVLIVWVMDLSEPPAVPRKMLRPVDSGHGVDEPERLGANHPAD
jgi:hypothetical protein